MTTATDDGALTEIAARGRITDDDVVMLRRTVFKDGIVTEDEAAALLELNESCDETSVGWRNFFAEAIVEFLAKQKPPMDYIAEDDAQFIMERICSDGRVKTQTELEALVKVLEIARSAPLGLVKFTLNEVKKAVLDPGTDNGGSPRERMSPQRIQLLRRILYAAGGDTGIAISRDEAELLFDINDAVANVDDNDQWCDLFAKAVASHVMAAFGRPVPTREEALRLERWLEGPLSGVGGFLTRFFTTKYSDAKAAYAAANDDWKQRNERTAAAIAENAPITLGEAEWLKDRMKRDGKLSRAETELLRFIKELSPVGAEALNDLVANARAA